jgi:hypothetical protein
MLFIPPHFPRIGLAKTDHADTDQGFRKHQSVDPAIDQAERTIARLGMAKPVIQPDQRRFKIETRCSFEHEAAFEQVALTLGGIEPEVRRLCRYNKSGSVQI